MNGGKVIPFLLEGAAEAPDLAEAMRMAEAVVFASAEPVSIRALAARLPQGVDVPAVMEALCASATDGRSAPRATSPS
jgi:segregation and condensation protein B